VLVDSGAAMCVLSNEIAARIRGLSITDNGDMVRYADGSQKRARRASAVLRIGDHRELTHFLVCDLQEFDIILGASWLHQHNPVISFRDGTLTFADERGRRHDWKSSPPTTKENSSQLHAIGATRETEPPAATTTTRTAPPTEETARARWELRFPALFAPMTGLPPNRPGLDHRIRLKPDTHRWSRPVPRMSPRDSELISAEIDTLRAKGLVRASTASHAAIAFTVKKGDEGLERRMVCDYRSLNICTEPDAFPMPQPAELFACTVGAKVFTSLDMANAFHQIRMAEDDIDKTAIRTSRELLEWLVMPFGLINAPATCQRLMNSVLRDVLGRCAVVYMDDILIYSKTTEQHDIDVAEVMQLMQEAELHLNVSKCKFARSEVPFLGHVIGREGLRMTDDKVRAIAEWPAPRSVSDTRRFLGFVNFNRDFIAGCSEMAAPLNDLCRKYQRFEWSAAAAAAFESLKTAVSTQPVLIIADPTQPFRLHTDASQVAVGAVLSQQVAGVGPWRPVAYMSKKLSNEAQRYSAHDREFLAIVLACRHFRAHLHTNNAEPFRVFTDHITLQYAQTQSTMSDQMARWMQELADFHFVIVYTKGTDNVVADALSRRPDHHDPRDMRAQEKKERCDEFRRLHSARHTVSAMSTVSASLDVDGAIVEDAEYRALMAEPTSSLAARHMTVRDGAVYLHARLVVPASMTLRNLILRESHDIAVSGHLGEKKTLARVKQRFYWPAMDLDIIRYVSTCSSCQANKPSHQRTPGMLMPLAIPEQPYDVISMDLITQLPPTASGFDAIVCFVDKLSGHMHCVATNTTIDAPTLADMLLRVVVAEFGMPKSIISDRDARFTSRMWRALFATLGTRLNMSTAYHPQTDGLTERANQTLEQVLRAYVNFAQNDWDKQLPAAQMAINSSVSPSTGFTPHFLCHGREMRMPIDRDPRVVCDNPTAEARAERLRSALVSARQHLLVAQQRQAKYADRKRRPLLFKVGDRVLLSTQHFVLKGVGRAYKLAPRYIGPLVVKRVVNDNAYELDLPPQMQIHPVFNVSRLKEYKEDARRPAEHQRPLPSIVDGVEEFEVEQILAVHGSSSRRRWLVKWLGFPEWESTWEPRANLSNATEKLREFEANAAPERDG